MQPDEAASLYQELAGKRNLPFGLKIDPKLPHRAFADFRSGTVMLRERSVLSRTRDQVKRDLIHEMAHMMLGKPGHGRKWKRIYREILHEEGMPPTPPMSESSRMMYTRLFWVLFVFLNISYYYLAWIGMMPGAPRIP